MQNVFQINRKMIVNLALLAFILMAAHPAEYAKAHLARSELARRLG